MVEGPGATRNGGKVQVAVGKTLAAAPGIPETDVGSPIDAESCNAPGLSSAPPTLPHHLAGELSGRTLEEAFTVGKELFLIFAASEGETTNVTHSNKATALRLHFGMNGSLVARKVKLNDPQKLTSGVPPWKKNNTPTLRLYLVDKNPSIYGGAPTYVVVEAWETAVRYPVSAVYARDKLMELSSRDVCSPLFHAQDVYTEMRKPGNNMMISDALLTQDIFPVRFSLILTVHKSTPFLS